MTTPKKPLTLEHAIADAMARLGAATVAEILGTSRDTLYKLCNPNIPRRKMDFLTIDKVVTLGSLLRAQGHPEFLSAAILASIQRTASEVPQASLDPGVPAQFAATASEIMSWYAGIARKGGIDSKDAETVLPILDRADETMNRFRYYVVSSSSGGQTAATQLPVSRIAAE